MIRTLTVAQVVALHHRIVDATGGAPGVRDYGQIEAALARPFAGFGGAELYPTLSQKAAALTHGLATAHPFVDGNKRIAITVGGVFLMLNGYRLEASQDDLEQTMWAVAAGTIDLNALCKWFRHHSHPMK